MGAELHLPGNQLGDPVLLVFDNPVLEIGQIRKRIVNGQVPEILCMVLLDLRDRLPVVPVLQHQNHAVQLLSEDERPRSVLPNARALSFPANIQEDYFFVAFEKLVVNPISLGKSIVHVRVQMINELLCEYQRIIRNREIRVRVLMQDSVDRATGQPDYQAENQQLLHILAAVVRNQNRDYYCLIIIGLTNSCDGSLLGLKPSPPALLASCNFVNIKIFIRLKAPLSTPPRSILNIYISISISI